MGHLVLILFHTIMKTFVLACGRINYEMGIPMLGLEKRIAELDPFITSLFVDFLYGRTSSRKLKILPMIYLYLQNYVITIKCFSLEIMKTLKTYFLEK